MTVILIQSKPPYEQQGLPPEEVTIAEVLKGEGYATFHIGKWHLGRQNGMAPHEQGFDQSLLMASALYLPEDDPNVVNAKLEFDPIDQFLWARLAFANSFNSGDQDRFEPRGYLTDYWTDESINIINANKNRPFFLYLGHWGVHTPCRRHERTTRRLGILSPTVRALRRHDPFAGPKCGSHQCRAGRPVWPITPGHLYKR